MPCFTQGLHPKSSHSLLTSAPKQWKWTQHPARSFCLGICWPTKAAKHNYKVPKTNINKRSSDISEVLHLAVDLKTKSKNDIGKVVLLSECRGPGCCPELQKCCTHDFQTACSSSAGGSLECLGLLLQQEESSATGMKAILSLTTHKSMPTFLLLVPYN